MFLGAIALFRGTLAEISEPFTSAKNLIFALIDILSSYLKTFAYGSVRLVRSLVFFLLAVDALVSVIEQIHHFDLADDPRDFLLGFRTFHQLNLLQLIFLRLDCQAVLVTPARGFRFLLQKIQDLLTIFEG